MTDVFENVAPTSLNISTTAVLENVAGGFTVGTFTTVDTLGDTFTYTLVSGPGATDNGAFTITGDTLSINASPNFEAKIELQHPGSDDRSRRLVHRADVYDQRDGRERGAELRVGELHVLSA